MSNNSATWLLVGRSLFEIRVSDIGDEREVSVTLSRDEREEWTYRAATWRPMAIGTACGTTYLWFARSLIVLPSEKQPDPVVLEVDEDLLVAYPLGGSWLLVCETSVRLRSLDREVARVELRDVVDSSRWSGEALVVTCQDGSMTSVSVAGTELSAQSIK